MVQGEGHFIAIGRQFAPDEHCPGIVDQHMQAGMALLERGGSVHDACQR